MAQHLPPEILGEIFVLCLQEHNFSKTQPNTSIPPLLLCHVCRSWRSAAFGTPHLWCELSVALQLASVQSHLGSGLFETIKLWNSCRGTLPPSLHFRGGPTLGNVITKFVPLETIFKHSAISIAEALTLSNFSLSRLSDFFKDMNFSNLHFLSILQPLNQAYKSEGFRFPACHNLRRLHFDSDNQLSLNPAGIMTTFSWRTLTHFRATLTLRRRDWRYILEQCVNLSFGIFFLTFWQDAWQQPPEDQGIARLPNLKSLIIHGTPYNLKLAVHGFIFPSLTFLCIYCTPLPGSLAIVHKLLGTTPSVEELHLHECFQFCLSDVRTSSSIGHLSNFAPYLKTLRIYCRGMRSELLLTLLHSGWLNNGWPHLSAQKSVEIVLYGDQVEDFNTSVEGKMDSSNFDVSSRHVRKFGSAYQPTAVDLRDRWDDLFTFQVFA